MTTDVPVFAQATVDQIDEFSRKLSITARGQIGPIDYRLAISDPFPITSSGSPPPPISENASFASMRHSLQQQAYVIWQFMDHEPHGTPYMAGTYLGKREVFNVAAGVIRQPNATWRTNTIGDTVYDNLVLFAVESFLDLPVSAAGNAVSAYLGGFFYDYGEDYLRYNGLMNPATGFEDPTGSVVPITGHGAAYGNAYPMFGTGQAIYSQLGYYIHRAVGDCGLLPYASLFAANWDRLGQWTTVVNFGCSLLMDGHRNKISVDVQNRPTYGEDADNVVVSGRRRTQVVLQYQVAF
jgi:hypothetical protein